MKGHGGARSGSGRPRKWSFDDMLAIGHDCEKRWREACESARENRLSALPHAEKIRRLQETTQAIPLPQRQAWLASATHEEHTGDIEGWLHDRAKTPFDDDTGNYKGRPRRGVRVSTRPPRGTRMRIIEEVALERRLSASSVDNLWQAYRRLRRETE